MKLFPLSSLSFFRLEKFNFLRQLWSKRQVVEKNTRLTWHLAANNLDKIFSSNRSSDCWSCVVWCVYSLVYFYDSVWCIKTELVGYNPIWGDIPAYITEYWSIIYCILEKGKEWASALYGGGGDLNTQQVQYGTQVLVRSSLLAQSQRPESRNL